MKALVTGAAGFIGSTLTHRLLNTGWGVLGVDRLSDYYPVELKRRNLARLERNNFTFHDGDLMTLDLERLLTGVDVVFHQAGQPGVRKSWGQAFGQYTNDNVLATQRLLEAATTYGRLQRFVYASSSSVYGEAERYPTLETDRPQPVSPYGVTKLAAEHLCNLYGRVFDLPTVSLRYFTVYGPRQRPDMAFAHFCAAALSGSTINVFGDGSAVRDFTYVDDIVQANMLAVERDSPAGTVMNVSGGSNVSVNEVLSLLQTLVTQPLRIQRGEKVSGDVSRTGGDSHLARDLLGWNPRTTLAEGLRLQLEHVAKDADR